MAQRADTEGAPGKRARLVVTVDDALYEEGIQWVRKERMKEGRTLTRDVLIDIIAVQLFERHEHYLASKRPGRPPKVNFAERTAAILKRDTKKCQQAWKQFMEEREVKVVTAEGPRGEKHTKIPRKPALRFAVREWLHEREAIRQRTVAKDLLSFLSDKGVFPKNVQHDKKGREAALRAVQRYAKTIGLARGKRKGQQTYLEREALIVARDTYVVQATELMKSRRFVFMDESYVHQHYKLHDDFMFDPEDKRPVPKDKMKGRRFCFIAAIISGTPAQPAGAAAGAAAAHAPPASAAGPAEALRDAHLITETIDVFEGGKQTKDYHGMFNSEYFVKWMETLLQALEKHRITNTVIVMDNAKYHKTLPPDLPKKSWKKPNLIAACNERGIPVDAKDTRPMLWAKLEKFLGTNAKPLIVTMAERAGHTVMFTPPRYSDLQPIELVWAIMKQGIGQQHTHATTFEEVRKRLEESWKIITPEIVEKCIDAANKNLAKLYDFIVRQDEADEEEEEEEEEEESEEEEEEEEGEEGDE
jgi:transposase